MNLNHIRDNGTPTFYDKNQIVFTENDVGDSMYIVISGRFGVYVNSFSDFPIKVADVTSGNFFGEMSVIDDSPRSATIIAEEDSLAVEIGKDAFPTIIEGNPDMADRILKTMHGRMQSTKEKITGIGKSVPVLKDELNIKDIDDGKYTLNNLFILARQIRAYNDILVNKTNDIAKLDKKKADGTIQLLPDNYTPSEIKDTNDNIRFLYRKQAVCPLCLSQTDIYIPVFSKLEVQETNLAQRVIYKDFDILWYTNCICVNCNYTDTYQEFMRYKQAAIKPTYRGNQFDNMEGFKGFVENCNHALDEVVMSYYLNIHCIDKTTKDVLKLAKAWQKLYWIYKDRSLTSLMKEAAKNVQSYYTKYTEIHSKTTGTDDLMRINMMLGEMFYEIMDMKEAVRYYKYNVELGRFKRNEFHQQSLKRIAELKYRY